MSRGGVATLADRTRRWAASAQRPILGPMPPIDLRSDTVTHPTPAMRRAMAAAEVGDDVFGDDPTVIALEARAAELLGKEAGLFVSSGTMGNLVAQMAHLGRAATRRSPAREHHIVLDEAGGHAVIVGTTIRALHDRPDGTIDPAAIIDAFRDPTRPPRADHAASSPSRTRTPTRWASRSARVHARGRGDRARARRPAPRRRRPVLQRRRRPGRQRGGPCRPGRQRHVLPVEGPWPARSARSSSARRRHLSRRAGAPEAAGRRHAPGRDPRGRRAPRPARRSTG